MQGSHTPSALALPDSCYDNYSAEIAVSFIKCLNCQTDYGKEQCPESNMWKERFLKDVFGIKTSNGIRQFTLTYVETSDEQQRLLFLSNIALLLTCADRNPHGEIIHYVSNYQQATFVFEVICDLVDNCKSLSHYFGADLHQKKLIYKPLNSVFQVVVQSDSKLKQNAHGILFDESCIRDDCNCLYFEHNDKRVIMNQPMCVITASSTVANKSNFFSMLHQRAIRTLEGKNTDPIFYPIISAY